MPFEPPDTWVTCPVPGCCGGDTTTRLETRTGYRVTHQRCAYCAGTGIVTPARYAAYRKLTEKDREKDK